MTDLKIRYKTWYWGKWVYSGSMVDASIVTIHTPGFELYDEDKHGLQNDNPKEGICLLKVFQ